MKRILAAVLILMVMLGLVGLASVPALADSPITITVFKGVTGSQPTANNKIYWLIEQELGVRFEFSFLQEGQDLYEAIGEMISSGNLPDIIDGGNAMDAVIGAEVLDDLLPMISEDGTPNLYRHIYTDDRVSKMENSDGEVFVVPNYGINYNKEIRNENTGPAFFIQKRVIAFNNYVIPKTLKEYFNLIERYLEAHPTDNDGNPTIGFLILCQGWQRFCLVNPVQHLMGRPNDGSIIVDPENGYHTETYIDKDYAKGYYAKLNEEYRKGVIRKDTFDMDYDEYICTLSEGNVLGMFDQGWDIGVATSALTYAGMYDQTYLAIPLVYDPEYVGGKEIEEHYQYGTVMNLNRGAGISSSCTEAKKRKIAQVMDTLLSDRWQKILWWGIEDEDYYVENGRMQMTDEQYEHLFSADWCLANKAEALFDMLPKKQGTMDDGNAWDPQNQPEHYQRQLNQYDREFLTSCGKGTFGEFFNEPIEPEPYGEAWQIDQGPIYDDVEEFDRIQDERLPEIIKSKADELDQKWEDFQDEIQPYANVVTDYMQEQILKFINEEKGELWGSGSVLYFTGLPDEGDHADIWGRTEAAILSPVDYDGKDGEPITDWTLTQTSGEEDIFELTNTQPGGYDSEFGWLVPAAEEVPEGDYKFKVSCQYHDRDYESPVTVHVYALTEENGINLFVAPFDTDSKEITGEWALVEGNTLLFTQGQSYALHAVFSGDQALANIQSRYYNTEMYEQDEESMVVQPYDWDWNSELGSYTIYRMPETGAIGMYEDCYVFVSAEGANIAGERKPITVFSLPPEINILQMPADTLEIEENAFVGVDADSVRIPAGCDSIGKNAFAESGIIQAHIAGTGTEIGDGAFPEGTVICAPEGSKAQSWAEDEKNGCYFVPEN